jgi:hypothetical protein
MLSQGSNLINHEKLAKLSKATESLFETLKLPPLPMYQAAPKIAV